MVKFLQGLSKTSTAALLAIMWTLGSIVFIYNAAKGNFHASETILTMTIQGVLSTELLVLGAYFSRSMTKSPASDSQ